MKRVRQMGLVLAATAGLAFAAIPAHAHPGAAMGMDAQGQVEMRGEHAEMQARMAQRMGQHHGEHRHGQKEAAAQGSCPMGAQASAQTEHKH